MAKAKKPGVGVLKKGDLVMIISGGNKKKKPVKGQIGKILKFVGDDSQRALVEGLNLMTKHQKAKTPGQTSGKVKKEAPIHISRLMFYVEKLKKPVRICHSVLNDGTKVRGYKDRESKKFVQLGE